MTTKRILTTSACIAIAAVLLLPLLREPGAYSQGLKGMAAFFRKDYAAAAEAFERARSASEIGKKRDYLRLGESFAHIESGNASDSIGPLGDLSFSGSDRIEAARWYGLGNAHAKDALSQSGQAQKTALEAALRAYERSFEIKWMPEAENNHWEVKKFLESRFPRDPIPGMRPQTPEPPKEPEWTGSGSEPPPETPKESEKTWSGEQAPEKDSDTAAGMDSGKTAGKKSDEVDDGSQGADSAETGTGAAGGNGTGEIAKPDVSSLKPESGKWTNAGNLRKLESSRDGNTGTGLSELERSELENNLGSLREMQKHQGQFVRPDGKIEGGAGGIPDAFQNFFRGDPIFERFFGEGGKDGKNW